MTRNQILRAQEKTKEKPSQKRKKKEKLPNREQGLITFYSVFRNIRIILEELCLLLAPDKEHKVFPFAPVERFHNGKKRKDYFELGYLKLMRLFRLHALLDMGTY